MKTPGESKKSSMKMKMDTTTATAAAAAATAAMSSLDLTEFPSMFPPVINSSTGTGTGTGTGTEPLSGKVQVEVDDYIEGVEEVEEEGHQMEKQEEEEEEVEKGESDDYHNDNDNDNSDDDDDNDVDDDDDDDDEEGEGDISRYQREIEERHRAKEEEEGGALSAARSLLKGSDDVDAIDDVIVSALLKVRKLELQVRLLLVLGCNLLLRPEAGCIWRWSVENSRWTRRWLRP